MPQKSGKKRGENSMKYYLAIDIGASSGRHIVGWKQDGEIITNEVYRFPNGMESVDGHLTWNTDKLFAEVKAGIAEALKQYPGIESLSIDTWGVDYVLMKGDEEVRPTYAYRDSRTEETIDLVHEIVSPEELFTITGTQHQSFNTIYQLYADKLDDRLDGVTDFLMIPEYLIYKLTGVKKKEFTNASTAALLNVNTLQLDENLFSWLGFPDELLKPIYMPGESVGRFTDEVAAEVGGNMEVVLCATHDTASAVEAIEMETDAPYISSGTWSLLGVKLDEALTDEQSRLSGYSNEGGVGYFTYLKNITGMWLIQSLRAELCPDTDYAEIAEMAESSSFEELFDVNDPSFMAPESMKAAIDEYLSSRGKPTPVTTADYFNSAYHSLASCYFDAISDLEENTEREYSEIYIVGGGAKNEYLNDLTERYTGRRVIAMPIEATAIGNLKVQMDKDEGKVISFFGGEDEEDDLLSDLFGEDEIEDDGDAVNYDEDYGDSEDDVNYYGDEDEEDADYGDTDEDDEDTDYYGDTDEDDEDDEFDFDEVNLFEDIAPEDESGEIVESDAEDDDAAETSDDGDAETSDDGDAETADEGDSSDDEAEEMVIFVDGDGNVN